MFTKVLLNPHEGLLTAQSLLWSFSIPATGTTGLSPSASHKFKELSFLQLPSIGLRIWTVYVGDKRTYKLISYTGLFGMIVGDLISCHTQYT